MGRIVVGPLVAIAALAVGAPMASAAREEVAAITFQIHAVPDRTLPSPLPSDPLNPIQHGNVAFNGHCAAGTTIASTADDDRNGQPDLLTCSTISGIGTYDMFACNHGALSGTLAITTNSSRDPYWIVSFAAGFYPGGAPGAILVVGGHTEDGASPPNTYETEIAGAGPAVITELGPGQLECLSPINGFDLTGEMNLVATDL